MITIHNYFQKIQDIDYASLPEKLRAGFLFVRMLTSDHQNWKNYEKNESIKVKADTYLALLNKHLQTESTNSRDTHHEPTPSQLPKKTADKKENSAKSPKALPIRYDHSKPTEHLSDEIKFIKRFLSLHQKTKTKDQVLNFINALQKAILERRIRKTSQYANEILQIQKQLVASHQAMTNQQYFEISPPTLKKYMDIVGSLRIRTATQLLKRFVGIQGKNITKEKAKRLSENILSALKSSKIQKADPYYDQVTRINKSLKIFIASAKTGDTLEINQQALNGLNGVLGCADNCDCKVKKTKKAKKLSGLDGIEEAQDVMSVKDAKQKKYDSVPLGPKWRELLGDICLPTHLFVYGSGGSGKTSFTLLLTQHLATLGYKILYVAGEQFDTPPFTKLLNQLNIIGGDHYKIVGKLDTLNPVDFDFVVLDTKDSLDIDTLEFLKLKEQFHKQSFIIVSHGIKTGEFKGKEQWRNIVDIMVQGEHGIIRTGHDKNRWGGAGEMLIYDHPKQSVIKE